MALNRNAEDPTHARDEDRLVERLRDPRRSNPPLQAAEVAQILEATASHRVRNAAALALADLRAEGAADRIGAALARPEVAPQSGTLLFALDEIGGTLPPEAFLNVVRGGSFEGRCGALHLLDEGRVAPLDADARAALVRRLKDFVGDGSTGGDAAEAAAQALALLDGAAAVPGAA